MVSNELRGEADWFVDLADARIKDAIIRRERDPREREPRESYAVDNMALNPVQATPEAVVVEDRRETAAGRRPRYNLRKA